jgi:hypothetical protein
MLLHANRTLRGMLFAFAAITSSGLIILAAGCGTNSANNTGLPDSKTNIGQVGRGRYLVTSVGCTECHNRGKTDPTDPKWLAGFIAGTPGQPFVVQGFNTYPSNLTPDATGIGPFTDRQMYNALRFGLDPANTADVIITSSTPGQGNFPATPHYLAPPMPWPTFRHLTDTDLWAIVAYLKHGLIANSNVVPPSEGPADFWAGTYAAANVGPEFLGQFPTSQEQLNP